MYNTVDEYLEGRGVQQELKCQSGVVVTLGNGHFSEEAAKKPETFVTKLRIGAGKGIYFAKKDG